MAQSKTCLSNLTAFYNALTMDTEQFLLSPWRAMFQSTLKRKKKTQTDISYMLETILKIFMNRQNCSYFNQKRVAYSHSVKIKCEVEQFNTSRELCVRYFN